MDSVHLSIVGTFATAFALSTARTASAEVPFQGALYGGAECFDGCSETGLLLGANALWTPNAWFAIGAMGEHIETSAEQRTRTFRFGIPARVSFLRGDIVEPYLHLAIGPALFEDRSAPCTIEAVAFAQGALGAEARITPGVHAGLGAVATQQAYAKSCGDIDRANWDRGPSFGLFASVRFGPVLDE